MLSSIHCLHCRSAKSDDRQSSKEIPAVKTQTTMLQSWTTSVKQVEVPVQDYVIKDNIAFNNVVTYNTQFGL